MIIAIDFDGTIVKDAYPKIGKERLFAFDVLKRLQSEGHQLILWTVRSGVLLDEAVAYCQENGMVFYAVNKNYTEENEGNNPRKLNADIFVDDRNVGGIKPWGEIYQLISGKEVAGIEKKGSKRWWKKN